MDFGGHLYAIIAAFLTSNVIAVIVSSYFSKSKETASTESIVSDNWKKLYDEISLERERIKYDYEVIIAREAECARNLLEHKIEIEKIKSELMLFSSFRQQLPIAWWIKDVEGKMKEISAEYERIFLEPNGKTRIDYIGNNDITVWGEEIGRAYMNNDKQVVIHRKNMKFKELVTIDGKLKVLRVEKMPIIFGEHVWGSMGFAFFDEWEE